MCNKKVVLLHGLLDNVVTHAMCNVFLKVDFPIMPKVILLCEIKLPLQIN